MIAVAFSYKCRTEQMQRPGQQMSLAHSDKGWTNSSWMRPAEQVMLAAVDGKTRVVGIISPQSASGVSTLCQMVAECYSRSGQQTLLADFTLPVITGNQRAWVPGENPLEETRADPRGYDTFSVQATVATRSQYNSVDKLRHFFNEDLSGYKAIIVDLPAILERREDSINPLAAARACDVVIMVCMTGRIKQQQVKLALAELALAGVQIGGTVLNDALN